MTLFATLAACGSESASGEAAAHADNRIECRIGNSPQFDRFCTVERDEDLLVVRKPDGGFRRLVVTRDGRGVAAADGAEPAQVTIIAGDRIEVAIGGDTFRLPATVRGR